MMANRLRDGGSRDLKYDQIAAMRAFARVVEIGSFTRAAATLSIPKATATKLIQTLEAHLQTTLLHRTTRRVSVTPDGAAYYERAVSLLADLEELDGSMRLSQINPKGRLRIDVSAGLATQVLIPALPDFHARFPDIQIDMGVTDRPVDLIGENVDCVIRAGTLTDQSLIARKIAEMHFVTCASPSYLQRHGEPAHPQDIESGHKVVGYVKTGTAEPWPLILQRDGEEREVSASHVITVNDGNAYVTAALAGLGIIHVPIFMVQEHITSGALRPIIRGWSMAPLPLHVVYPPNKHLSNKLRIFVDWVADLFARSKLIQQREAASS
jgi:LysR family transcriptional regulator, regulator for bpeEF and oprC